MTPLETLEACLAWALEKNEPNVTVPTDDLRAVLAWRSAVTVKSYEEMTPDQQFAWKIGAEAAARPRREHIEDLHDKLELAKRALREIEFDQRNGCASGHPGYLARKAITALGGRLLREGERGPVAPLPPEETG